MNPNHPTRIDGRIFPTPPSAATPFPLKEGIKVIHTTLTAGQTYKVSFSTPNLMNITIRIANSTQLSANTTLKVYFHNYKTMNTVYYTLNTNRYGVFIDNKPLDYIIFENLDEILTIDIYMEYLIKSYHEPFQEEVQFITVIQELPPPPSTQLFQGTNNRYNGTLADATFFGSVPLGTNMAVRQINSESSSTTEIGIVEIPLAANMTYHANLAPTSYIQYGQNSTSEIVVFTSDSVTQQLPSSATQSYATTNQIIVDYQFDYNLSVAFSSGYTISTSGTTTSISFSGNANAYYYSNPSLYFANASLSLSESESQYTLSPTSGTTNSSGKLPFTFSETLNSTATLPANDITVSADIAGISKTSSSTLTPNFNYGITLSIGAFSNTDNPTSGNYQNVTYTSDTTLTGNINAMNITINSGVTITTNGYYLYAVSDFTNNGTLTGGNNSNAPGGGGSSSGADGGAGTSITTSYAGSAGGGGGTETTLGHESAGGSGGSTLTSGGGGGGISGVGGNGSTPSAPSMSSSLASDMFKNIEGYLSSASGGGGGGTGGAGVGGNGAEGVYGVAIGGNNVTAGTINVNGNTGSGGHSGVSNAGGGGGGGSGSGAILIVYNSSYTAGTYSYSGGNGGTGGGGPGGDGGNGGTGGNGQLITYQTSSPIVTTSITNTLTSTITATYNSQPIPNQTISLKITGTGSASFSSSSTVTSTTATTDSSGQVTVTIYSINSSDNTLTASATVAGITNSASITI